MINRITVVVVDDEKLIAKSIVRNIEKENSVFKVIGVAHDGEKALELVEELLPNVVFTDIKMPIMDGIELIFILSIYYPHIKKVMVSGYNDFEFVKAALKENAFDYLLKPINAFELKKVLRRMEDEICAEKHLLKKQNEHTSPDEAVNQIVAFLNANYHREIEMAVVAQNLGFSSSYLTKIFKEKLSITPYKFLNKLRIDTSKKMLRDTELSVKEIAENVGFLDQFHFSKNFKLLVGLSPAQYRANLEN